MSEEALQIAEKRREVKGKGETKRYTHPNAEFQRIARRDKKAFLTCPVTPLTTPAAPVKWWQRCASAKA